MNLLQARHFKAVHSLNVNGQMVNAAVMSTSSGDRDLAALVFAKRAVCLTKRHRTVQFAAAQCSSEKLVGRIIENGLGAAWAVRAGKRVANAAMRMLKLHHKLIHGFEKVVPVGIREIGHQCQ